MGEFEVERGRILQIPTLPDGGPYRISYLQHDQKGIVATVLETLNQWLNCDDLAGFRPLRMTVVLCDSSGKSAVIETIKTLVSVLRKLFGTNDVVRVTAPNGAAAYNAGGETFDHLLDTAGKSRELWRRYREYWPNSMRREKRALLIRKFRALLCLIVDERNLVGSNELGSAERMIAETVYGGGNRSTKSFGGIPVVILFGDDYRVAGFNRGGFRALYSEGVGMTEVGRRVLLECAECVVGLKGPIITDIKKSGETALLNRLRVGDKLTRRDGQKLMSLHILALATKHGNEAANNICKNAVFLYVTENECLRPNLIYLSETCSKKNPAVILFKKSIGPNGSSVGGHFSSKRSSPRDSIICVNATVRLHSKNICPLWGLHIGACGVVKEIVFAKGCSPANGDSPSYVIVDFPKYCGPQWDASNPTVSPNNRLSDQRMHTNTKLTHDFLKFVPIPTTKVACKANCCTQEYVPLELAYAQTIHNFQGLSAGPVKDGETPNVFDTVVCDPGGSHCETHFPGLLYTAVSSATTLGDDDGLNSALYFTGNCITYDRLNTSGKHLDGQNTYLSPYFRSEWVQHLSDNHHSSPLTRRQKLNLFTWAESHSVSSSELFQRVNEYQEAGTQKSPSQRNRTSTHNKPNM